MKDLISTHSDTSVNSALNRVKGCLNYSLKEKYGIDNEKTTSSILKIHGLHKDNFEFINNFEALIEKGINNNSVDANANKSEITINGLGTEIAIPVQKIIGYRYLYRKMVEMYGKKRAKFLMGEMYDYSLALADSSKILTPYCFAVNASRLTSEGRPFGKLHSTPAKRPDSYISSLNETIHQLSNVVAGALAPTTIFLDVAKLMITSGEGTLTSIVEDKEYRKTMENEFQHFIHSMNSLSRSATESPFTNVSLFDRPKLQALLEDDNMGWYFTEIENKPDDFFTLADEGTEQYNKDWKEYITELVIELQWLFTEIMDRGDVANGGAAITFPVTTVNLSKKKNADGVYEIEDKKFLKKFCTKEIYRYNIYASEGTKVASCCFDKDEKCLIKDSVNGVQKLTFEEAYNTPRNGTNFSVYHNGYFLKGKPVKINLDEDRKMYKITTSNNKSFIVTDNHINVTDNGDKKTSNLTVNDYLMFNTTELKTKSKNQFSNKDLSYNLGMLIGAYLGDGSCYVAGENKGQNRITFSLNLKKDKELIPYFESALKELDIKSNITINEDKNNCSAVTIASDKLYSFIKEYVHGGYAYDKSLDMKVLDESLEFRQGILKGHYLTDGGNSNRIYSVSTKLIEDMETLINSLGLVSTISIADRTDEKVVIREEEFNRNYPLYCIRWYEKSKRTEKDIYKQKNGNYYFKITSIEEIKNYKEKDVYCFEMKNEDEPYFTLPNGLVTHNCRLINDSELMSMGGQVNSFGGTSISLGSHRVNTINLKRISIETRKALEGKNATAEEALAVYKEILNDRMDSASDVLKAHKELLKDFTDMKTQQFIENGWLDLDKMFSTFGLIGYYEANKDLKENFGGDIDYLKEILTFIEDRAKEISAAKKMIINIEQIPGESMMQRLAIVDRALFGKEYVPEEIYANQFVPLFENGHTLWERMEVDGEYGSYLTGGGICHFSLGEKVTPKQAEKIIVFAVENNSEHFALNPVFSVCSNETPHTTFGKSEVCPVCGKPIRTYITRTIGFFTAVEDWSDRKKKEDFDKRDYTSIDG